MSYPSPINQAFRGTESYQGGSKYFVHTSSQGTNVQLIKNGGGRLAKVTNTGLAAQTANISYYDSPTIVNPATNGTLLFTVVPGATASQQNPTPIDIPFTFGLVAVASAAITGTVLTQYL
jgi:hypothetical protein